MPKKTLSEVAQRLNPKHRKVAETYVTNGYKPQAAYVAAGYSKKSAPTEAYKLLRKPDMQAYVRELMQPELSDSDALAQGKAIFQKLLDIVAFNLADVVEVVEEGDDKGLVKLKAKLDDLPRHLTACLDTVGNTESKRGKTLLNIKRIDPTFALRLLARFYAYDMNPDEVLARARSFGLELVKKEEGGEEGEDLPIEDDDQPS